MQDTDQEKAPLKRFSANIVKLTRGFTIIEVVIALGIISLLMLGTMTMTSSMLKVQSQSNLAFELDSTRRELVKLINNDSAWLNTVSDVQNSSSCSSPSSTCNPLTCMLTPASCISGSGGKILVIRDQSIAPGSIFYDWQGSKILTAQGTVCSSFVSPPTSGDSKCPYRFEISWLAQCATPTGTVCGAGGAMAKIAIVPIYNPKAEDKIAFNPLNYAANFYQGSTSLGCNWSINAGALVENCADVGIRKALPQATLDVGGPTIIRLPLNPSGTVATDMGNLLSFRSNWPSGGGVNYLSMILEDNGGPTFKNVVIRNPSCNVFPTDDAWLMAFRAVPTLGSDQIGVFGGGTNTANDRFSIIKGDLQVMSGKVAVKLVGSAVYPVDVGGDINTWTAYRVAGTTVCTAAGCTAVSDRILKTNISPLEDSLEKILQLHGVAYDWKNQAKYGTARQIGLVAQDAEKIFPEIVVNDKTTGLKSIAYDHLAAPLIESVRTIKSLIDSLGTRSADLERANRLLEARIARMESHAAQMGAELRELKLQCTSPLHASKTL